MRDNRTEIVFTKDEFLNTLKKMYRRREKRNILWDDIKEVQND